MMPVIDRLTAALVNRYRVIYLHADIEAPVRSLRVVPSWVATMKRAVDGANN